MLSDKGKHFLGDLLAGASVNYLITSLAFSERITVALDLQIIVKQLVREIEAKTGEDIFGQLFEESKEH